MTFIILCFQSENEWHFHEIGIILREFYQEVFALSGEALAKNGLCNSKGKLNNPPFFPAEFIAIAEVNPWKCANEGNNAEGESPWGWCGWCKCCGGIETRLPMWAGVGVGKGRESGSEATGMGIVGPINDDIEESEVKECNGWLGEESGDCVSAVDEGGTGLFVPKLKSESEVSLGAGDPGGVLASRPSSVSVDSGLFPNPIWCCSLQIIN